MTSPSPATLEREKDKRLEIRAVRRDLAQWSAANGVDASAVLCALDAAAMSRNPHPVIISGLAASVADLAVRAAR
jgi:hypothetical protein